MNKNIEEILKEIALSIIPIQDREVILEMVISQLQESIECNATFVLLGKSNKSLTSQSTEDNFPEYNLIADYFYNRSDFIEAKEIKKEFKSLYYFYEPKISLNSIFLPIHSFEELQAIVLVVPVKNQPFSSSTKNAFSMLLYYLIIAFDRITQIERLEQSLAVIEKKNKFIESINNSLKQKVSKEIKKSTKAYKLIEEMSFNAMLTNLNAGIAHEINNPLTIMQLDIEFMNNLKMGNANQENEFKEYLLSLEKNILKIKEITSTLIKYGLASSKEKKRINLSEIISDIELMVNGYVKRHQIVFNIEDQIKSCFIQGDQIRVYQVFMNLLQNSFKALKKENKKLISITLSKIAINQDSFISVSVADSGCGMSEQELDSLFQPKFKESLSPEEPNLGLGLSIVKTIIEDHGAEIIVNSQISKGTTIEMRFKEEVLVI